MDNTSLMFIKLHRKYQKITPIEYFIEINKIIAITPHNNGTTIVTVSSEVFWCEESVDEVIKLMDKAFKSRLKERILK